MNHPDYNSPVELKNFLEANGLAMQKKFGQNFMVNGDARKKIVDSLQLVQDELVWEVGPGLGCMTEEIMDRGAKVSVFEIDRGFINLLHQFFVENEKTGKFKIIEGDVLKNWKKEFDSLEKKPSKLFGNLPYNIAATFIADTITDGVFFDRCVFTVQKEVTQRIVAKAGTENYSAFSVLCQFAYDVKSGIELAAGNFWPRPNVASQSVIMTKRENQFDCKNPSDFVKLVHALFSARRKTIANNIKSILPPSVSIDDFFERAGISKSERAENLSVNDFVALSNILTSVKM